MFTGLVEAMVRVVNLQKEGSGTRFSIDLAEISEGVRLGDSISLNGCCLTVVALQGTVADFEAGEETLKRTNLGRQAIGNRLNAERSLRVGDRMGGHYVTGHIDGVAPVSDRSNDGKWSYFRFAPPKELLLQMASKGSVAVDGVSLTLVDVTDHEFSVALIPHTLDVTTLGARKVGDLVNIETDVLAKYVQRQLQGADKENS